MADIGHRDIDTAEGIHIVHAFAVANAAARAALTVGAADVGKACLQTDTGRFYLLVSVGPATWRLLDASGTADLTTEVITSAATALTLAAAHIGNYLRLTAGTAVALTVPTNAAVPLAVGSSFTAVQAGAGQVTLTAAGGVTLNTSSTLRSRTQYSTVSGIKVATDVWDVAGDLAI